MKRDWFLQFDHVNPKLKLFDVLRIHSFSKEKREKELLKCQLLCRKCHRKKSLAESGKKPAKNAHGTVSSYRYCHCARCKEAKRRAAAEYRDRKRPFRRCYEKGLRHGSRTAYVHYGCRCSECRGAQAAYARWHRAKQS